eukprot:GILJ01011018.1.p1 GENE.GILJ01011018.1~~GILJ01011018.1.p1  ORF type:complete len:317 (+),score=22.78 GILJ01011018.1:45-995(+)
MSKERQSRQVTSFATGLNVQMSAWSHLWGNWQRRIRYSQAHAALEKHGFDEDEIRISRSLYAVEGRKVSFIRNEPNSMRFVYLPLRVAATRHILSEVVNTVVSQVDAMNESEIVVMKQDPNSYHVTIFLQSRIEQVRLPENEDALAKELEAVHRLASQTDPIMLELDRIIVTATGTVVACWMVCEGNMDQLRLECERAFPSAPTMQARIWVHTSLCRVLHIEHRVAEFAWRMMALNALHVSKRVRGHRVLCDSLRYEIEQLTQSGGAEGIDIPLRKRPNVVLRILKKEPLLVGAIFGLALMSALGMRLAVGRHRLT